MPCDSGCCLGMWPTQLGSRVPLYTHVLFRDAAMQVLVTVGPMGIAGVVDECEVPWIDRRFESIFGKVHDSSWGRYSWPLTQKSELVMAFSFAISPGDTESLNVAVCACSTGNRGWR